MQISKAMADLINEQIAHELIASNQYLQLATYFDGLALRKLSNFFYKQSEEEREHALKFVHYMTEVGGDVRIHEIPAANYDVKSAEHAFQMSLDWEKEVTRRINVMMDQAVNEKDYASQAFLQWFVSEQVEEEDSMGTMLQIVKQAGEKNLLMVEAYMTHGG